MFSSRFHWDLRPNALTGRLRARGEAGANLLDLTESNPTRAGIRYPAKEILDAWFDQTELDPTEVPNIEKVKQADR